MFFVSYASLFSIVATVTPQTGGQMPITCLLLTQGPIAACVSVYYVYNMMEKLYIGRDSGIILGSL